MIARLRLAPMGAAFLLVGACANGTTTSSGPVQPASPTAPVPTAVSPATPSAVSPATPSAGTPASAPAPTAAGTPLVIHIRNYAYTPAAPVVAVGQPIEIVNDDDVAHTWSAAPKAGWSYTSGNLEKGQRATFPGFAKPGSYKFVCYYHAEMPSMTGVTTVTKAP